MDGKTRLRRMESSKKPVSEESLHKILSKSLSPEDPSSLHHFIEKHGNGTLLCERTKGAHEPRCEHVVDPSIELLNSPTHGEMGSGKIYSLSVTVNEATKKGPSAAHDLV